jgi:hypothetical protein
MRYCRGFSPEGTCAVRFQVGPQANAMRSEAKISAILELTLVGILEAISALRIIEGTRTDPKNSPMPASGIPFLNECNGLWVLKKSLSGMSLIFEHALAG